MALLPLILKFIMRLEGFTFRTRLSRACSPFIPTYRACRIRKYLCPTAAQDRRHRQAVVTRAYLTDEMSQGLVERAGPIAMSGHEAATRHHLIGWPQIGF
jgi:hypothetical protein